MARELTNGRIEAAEASQWEASVGGGGLEDIGCQHGVSTRPGHLLTLVFHPPVLKPDLQHRQHQISMLN